MACLVCLSISWRDSVNETSRIPCINHLRIPNEDHLLHRLFSVFPSSLRYFCGGDGEICRKIKKYRKSAALGASILEATVKPLRDMSGAEEPAGTTAMAFQLDGYDFSWRNQR